jgi:hypothetical protein
MNATLIVLLLLPIAFINHYFLLKRLERLHHKTWIFIEAPKLGNSNLSTQTESFSKHLWGGKFFCLNDSQLSFMCIISIVLWLGAFIAFMFVLFS